MTTIYRDEVTATDFQHKVLEFILSPECSNPSSLMAELTAENFFSKELSLPALKEIVKQILNGQYCEPSKKKFREHMGELLDPPKPKVTTVVLEVDVTPGAYGISGSCVKSDVQTAIRKTWPIESYYKDAVVRLVEVKK